MPAEIIEAVRALAAEKNIPHDTLIDAIEDALLSAYKKTPGAARYARVSMDHDNGDFVVWQIVLPPALEAELIAAAPPAESYIDPATGDRCDVPEPELDLDALAGYEDQITYTDVTPAGFGRIAAQTAKQVILRRVREAERDMLLDEYRDRVGELIIGVVAQADARQTLVQLRAGVEAHLPRSEQIDGERLDRGQRVKAIIVDVAADADRLRVVLSRRSPELVAAMFEMEVPEIIDGLVEVVAVARDPGQRAKLAVCSHANGVDPVGACIGPRGSRVRAIVSELRGERVDIIPAEDDPVQFVAKAMTPARVREVLVDDDAHQMTVVVPDEQLAAAIGREGQNVRLASQLTGWRITVISETESIAADSQRAEDDDEPGRCAAVLSTGRRCPNATAAGSRYCGLDAHRTLAR